MKKLKLKKALVLCVGTVLILSMLIIPGSASVGTKDATLTYNDIKITLDGAEIVPMDANGNAVEPFIIDGTTYLPVRGIGNALNLGVEWNSGTNTVVLTSPTNTAISVLDAVLTEADGAPKLSCHVSNNLDTDITGFRIAVYCYDAAKKPIIDSSDSSSNIYVGLLSTTYQPRVPRLINIPLPNFVGTKYVEVAITRYTTADGTFNIPLAQQEHIKVGM